jgi:hypothetical protein
VVHVMKDHKSLEQFYEEIMNPAERRIEEEVSHENFR